MSETATQTQPDENGGSKPLAEANSFQRDLLIALRDLSAPHGLGIRDYLVDAYDEQIRPPRIYDNLDKLADRGLVEKSEKDKRTNEYTLTDLGRRELAADTEFRTNERE